MFIITISRYHLKCTNKLCVCCSKLNLKQLTLFYDVKLKVILGEYKNRLQGLGCLPLFKRMREAWPFGNKINILPVLCKAEPGYEVIESSTSYPDSYLRSPPCCRANYTGYLKNVHPTLSDFSV